MAQPDVSFPKIAEANWFKVRDLFKRKVPAVVSPNFLASALNMTESSARSNLLTPLKKVGLLTEDGKPTDLAYAWRDDEKYPSVCQTILEQIYPQEVRDFYHDLSQDVGSLVSWFMNYCRCGEPAARMYATFYRVLLRADPNWQEQVQAKSQQATNKVSRTKGTKATAKAKPSEREPAIEVLASDPATTLTDKRKSVAQLSAAPQVHINIQLHIAPDTTADQIDKIFDSMARHLRSLVEITV